MKTVRTLTAVHVAGEQIRADQLIEVDDGIAAVLIAGGEADAHPYTVAYCLSRGDTPRSLGAPPAAAPKAAAPVAEAPGLTTENAAPLTGRRSKRGS